MKLYLQLEVIVKLKNDKMNVLIDYFFVIGPSSEDGHHPKVSNRCKKIQ